MYNVINYGLVKCDNGVTIKIGRENISYIKDKLAIGVTIENLVDHTIIIYGSSVNWRNPATKGAVSLEEKNEVLKTIQDVLSYMELKYELVD